jgi:hypothetical protein
MRSSLQGKIGALYAKVTVFLLVIVAVKYRQKCFISKYCQLLVMCNNDGE